MKSGYVLDINSVCPLVTDHMDDNDPNRSDIHGTVPGKPNFIDGSVVQCTGQQNK